MNHPEPCALWVVAHIRNLMSATRVSLGSPSFFIEKETKLLYYTVINN